MTDQTFCGGCGARRHPETAFCGSCGAAFTTTSASQGTVQQGLASGLIEIEKMRAKLVAGRLAGISVGLALWWFILGPTFGGDFIPTSVSLVVVLFGGLYVGQMLVLSLVRR